MLHLPFLVKFKGLILLCSINEEYLQFNYNLCSKHLFSSALQSCIGVIESIISNHFFKVLCIICQQVFFSFAFRETQKGKIWAQSKQGRGKWKGYKAP